MSELFDVVGVIKNTVKLMPKSNQIRKIVKVVMKYLKYIYIPILTMLILIRIFGVNDNNILIKVINLGFLILDTAMAMWMIAFIIFLPKVLREKLKKTES